MTQVAVIETDAVVTTMNRARAALAEAKTIQETKRIVDAAAAAEIYARRQKLGDEASDLAQSIKVEALRKLGEMLQATPKATGAKGIGKSAVPKENRTLTDLGLTKKESAVAQKLAAMPDEAYQQVREGHITVSKAIAAVDAVKPAAKKTAKQVKAEEVANDAHSDFDPLAELEEAQRTIETLTGEIKAAEADDLKAEAMKWRKAYDAAVRGQSEAMDRAKKAVDREAWSMRQLRRCGKAIEQDDPDKIAAAVEGFVRNHKRIAA